VLLPAQTCQERFHPLLTEFQNHNAWSLTLTIEMSQLQQDPHAPKPFDHISVASHNVTDIDARGGERGSNPADGSQPMELGLAQADKQPASLSGRKWHDGMLQQSRSRSAELEGLSRKRSASASPPRRLSPSESRPAPAATSPRLPSGDGHGSVELQPPSALPPPPMDQVREPTAARAADAKAAAAASSPANGSPRRPALIANELEPPSDGGWPRAAAAPPGPSKLVAHEKTLLTLQQDGAAAPRSHPLPDVAIESPSAPPARCCLDPIAFGTAQAQGLRAYMEDRHAVVQALVPLSSTGHQLQDGVQRSFAAIYDGLEKKKKKKKLFSPRMYSIK